MLIHFKKKILRIIIPNCLTTKIQLMEKHSNHLSSALIKATACAFLSMGCLPMMAEAGSLGTDAVAMVQQQVSLNGTVLDANGDPIIGANVMEKGTTNGTITDFDGKFTLSVSRRATLVISYIGYKTLEVPASQAKGGKLEVTLAEDSEALEEVVVIGYGTQKKADVTSAVASVKAESFNKGAILDAGQLVQGKVAGLQISLNSGDPTASTSVMLRGNSSLKGSSSPLILVDGVPGSFSTVAPEEIESIDVLKDGSATAIYGTRGTNGVIIITTKNANREMPATIEYNGYVSVSTRMKEADFMSAEDLRARMKEGWEFSGANDKDYGDNVDWVDEVSRTGITHNHNLTFRGGGKNTSLIGSLNYSNRQGTFKKSDNENIRGRLEFTHRMFNDKLTTNLAIIANESTSGVGFNTNVYRYACIQNPTQSIYDENGNYVERQVYFYDNPISILNETDGMNRRRNVRFTGSLTYRPYADLTLKAMYTRKGQSSLSGSYVTHKHPSTVEGGTNGSASRSTSDYIDNLVELTADWHKMIGKHNLGAIIGYNYEDQMSENFSASNSDFPTDSYSYNKLQAGNSLVKGNASMSSYKATEKLIGLFARATWNYDDRYLVMFSIRREGSSKFGKDHKWGNFPGVSVGWRLNNEEFMKDLTWLDNLKVRAGYGITGINVGASYGSLASLNYSGYFFYAGKWVNQLQPVRNANPDLRWEKKHEYNFGIDFDMFGGRLGGAIDFYMRDTKDGLWDYSVPVPPYQYGSIQANVGQIRNTGLEILVNAVPVRTKNFEWNTNVSYSTNKNELRSISNEQFQMSTDWFTTGHTGEPIQTSTHRVKVGDPMGNFFGLKSIGLSEEGKWLVERLEKDAEGNVIGKFYDLAENAKDDDRQVLGNGVPTHYLNFNNTLRYKNWDMSIGMRGAFGFQILNFQEMYYGNPTIQYNVLNSAFDKREALAISADGKSYSKTGKMVNIADAQRYVSEYVEDGDYWKIDNVTIGYTFNTKKMKYVKNLRVYASCLNLAVLTSYKGIDPEVRFTGLDAGTDSRDKYPTNRSFTFGINATF